MVALGNQALSRAAVFRWFSEFKRGLESLQDEERSGRLSSVIIEEQVASVCALVEEGARMTVVAHLLEETNLS